MLLSVVVCAALVIAWLVLNHFRVEFYNSAIEGPSPEKSPFWTIIRIQEILEWPIFTTAILAGILILFEVARKAVLLLKRP